MAIVELALAFLAGVTISGMAGSLLELVLDCPLTFSEPYVSRNRVVRSIATTLVAGPLMFTNDALAARRTGLISRLSLALCGCTAVIWATSLGVVVTSLMSGGLRPSF